MGRGGNHPPPSENRDFSAIEHSADPKPVCKLEYVGCCPVEKEQNALSVLVKFSCGGLTKFKSTFFQIAKLRFLTIFADFGQNYRIFKFKTQGPEILESSPSDTDLSP